VTDFDVAARIASLAPAQRSALLRQLRQRQDGAETAATTTSAAIPRLPRPDPALFALSFAQRRVWFLEQFEPGTAQHNMPVVLALDGDLDPVALQRALDILVIRHEALRTTLVQRDGQPWQLIGAPYRVAITQADLTGEDETQRDAVAHEVIAEDVRRGFDLETGPLWRVTVISLTAGRALLLLNIHHSIGDGASTEILLRELVALYADPAAPLAPPRIQYADYAVWQRDWLSGPRLAELTQWWCGQLVGTPPLNLPTDRPRPPIRGHRGALESVLLPEPDVQALTAFGLRHGVTLYVTLLAGLEVLLARYAGQTDFAVGTVLAGRDRPELDGVVGFLANTVAIRSDIQPGAVEPNQTFDALAALVHERVLGAHEHTGMPFERIVDELKLPRDVARPPLFSVILVLQDSPLPVREMSGLRMRAVEPDTRASQVDITFYATRTDAGLELAIEYSTDLYDAETVRRMARSYRALLAGAVTAPGLPIRLLPLIDDAERYRMLTSWNATVSDYPARSLAELIMDQADRTPDAVAVRQAETGAALTYRELVDQAGRIASWLSARGAGPGTLVGVGVERGPDLIAAVLGVLRSGAAYVPLDPDYPAQRLAMMIGDADLRLAVAHASTVDRLPLGDAVTLVLDGDNPGGGELSEEFGRRPVHPDQLAYVIYTSGSTGRPKGVAISHRALVNLLVSLGRRCRIDGRAVLLSMTSLSFDMAGLELFAPLLASGEVVVAGRETARSGEQLAQTCAEVRPTIMQATPATWQLLIDAGWQGQDDLVALCGGEAVPPELAVTLGARVGELWNMYGPTETTIWSAAQPIDPADVCIGGTVANTRVYLLDSSGEPLPPGVPGEIHLGGDSVARGYHGRPGLTAERFVPDPLVSGARMFRTGDQAKFRPDGTLTFLGRLDSQVKVRGYRIELGDVEAALASHPGVAQAVVAVRDGALAGYVVPVSGAAPSVAELRAHLGQRLPGYMIPARFAELDALPLTPNGKIDRNALPAPGDAAIGTGVVYRPAEGVAETTLARIWQDLLGVAAVGRDDNFFASGGDSLIAVRMVSYAGQAGLRLTTKQVFQHQTLAELAAAAGTVAIQAEQGDVTGPMPLPIAVHQFHDGHNPQPGCHTLTFRLECRIRFAADLLAGVLGQLVRQHDVLRIRYVPGPDGGRGHLEDDPVRSRDILACADLSALSDAEQDAEVDRWTQRLETCFDVTAGDLFRAVLLEFGADRPQQIVLAGHYQVADLTSWHIMVADLDVMYRRASRGEAHTQPAKTTSQAEWLDRLTTFAGGQQVAGEIDYWTDPSRRTSTSIPVDRPDGDNTIAAHAAAYLHLDVAELRDLQARTKAAGLPMDSVLLAGVAHAVTRDTGAGLLPVDIYVPGRDTPFEDIDLSRTMGWLTYRYPVCLRLADRDQPLAYASGVDRELRAVPGGGLGYGALRYYRGDAALAAELAGQAVPQVLFNFFGTAPGGFQTFRPLVGTSGHYHDAESERMRLLMINGTVFRGQLRMEWEYSSGRHDSATIEGFIDSCRQFLLDLTDACPPAAQ
jgi:amino acid adenylation domain-containing protein/non-ribosomal peptide synthase protein (TIGR01720 family)